MASVTGQVVRNDYLQPASLDTLQARFLCLTIYIGQRNVITYLLRAVLSSNCHDRDIRNCNTDIVIFVRIVILIILNCKS